jgi:phosphoribosylformylglycinamidine synthase
MNEQTQPLFVRNRSSYECRWVTAQILSSPSIMLKGMEGSSIGIWIAHGEGYIHFPDKSAMDYVKQHHLAPIAFSDGSGPTEAYPLNPNGAPNGWTALCDESGRHLALMPHPERSLNLWNFSWLPQDWKKLAASPWLRMFQNAREWCDQSMEVKRFKTKRMAAR